MNVLERFRRNKYEARKEEERALQLREQAIHLALQANQIAIHAEVRALRKEIAAEMPGNPCLYGRKVYSQFDEDGIIEHIFASLKGNTFLEIGCGNGLENNTHFLLLKGWRGVWVDADERNIDAIQERIPANPWLTVRLLSVNTDNCHTLLEDRTFKNIDFLSLDIDGNDLQVLKKLLTLAKPKVICVEYNAKFPPPLDICIKYSATHVWGNDDYHGASLMAIVKAAIGYRLVACNLLGSNAFFVREDLDGFADYPPEKLYQPLRLHLLPFNAGHPATFKFLRDAVTRPTFFQT